MTAEVSISVELSDSNRSDGLCLVGFGIVGACVCVCASTSCCHPSNSLRMLSAFDNIAEASKPKPVSDPKVLGGPRLRRAHSERPRLPCKTEAMMMPATAEAQGTLIKTTCSVDCTVNHSSLAVLTRIGQREVSFTGRPARPMPPAMVFHHHHPIENKT